MDLTKIIKNAIDSDKIIIGNDTTEKLLTTGSLEMVIVSSNCPKDIRQSLETKAKISGSKVETFSGTNADLGATARKPFSISVLGIKK